MRRPLTRAEIERAVRLPGAHRSDYDIEPALKAEMKRTRPLRPAAVLCPIVERPAGLSLILTTRPTTMREHAGQVAFPGGKIDPHDPTPEDAALREAAEEIGLPRTMAEILGRIDPYETGTGFRVEPVVAMIDPGFVPAPDPREVADIFEAPLDFLMDPANLRTEARVWQGRRRRYYAIPWSGRYIWGATAGMLKSLMDRVDRL